MIKDTTTKTVTITLTTEQIESLEPLLKEAEDGFYVGKKIIVLCQYGYDNSEVATFHALTHQASNAVQDGLFAHLGGNPFCPECESRLLKDGTCEMGH